MENQELQEFVANFASLFDRTDLQAFTADTRFKELDEWSSLSGLLVIDMVNENYDVVIKGDDVRRALTIEDLYHAVIRKKEK